MFHDILHDCFEDTLMWVNFKKVCNHVKDLMRVFKICLQYKLRMNPLKFALVQLIYKSWDYSAQEIIDLNPTKTYVIQAMKSPTASKQPKSFIGIPFVHQLIPF